MGLFCHGSHDSAVALVDDSGRVIYASEQERFDRKKHSSRFPTEAIQNAFAESGYSWKDIQAVGFAWDPFADLDRIAKYLILHSPHAAPILFRPKQKTQSRLAKWLEMRRVPKKLRELGWSGGEYKNWNHHLCHAASTYFASGFSKAASLSVDGNGEFASTTIHSCDAGQFRAVDRIDYPHSLGHFYATITQYLGFRPLNDEYKVMGLAAFGRTHLHEWREKIDQVLLEAPSGFALELKYFQFHLGQDRMWSPELEKLLGPSREIGASLEPRHEAIAAAVQDALERAILRLSARAQALTGHTRLCLSGGVALNCLANERLYHSHWEEIFILPAPHDSGSALGAAFLARKKDFGLRMHGAALGASIQCPEAPTGPWQVHALNPERIKTLAAALAQGKTVAWARGRSEFGPRALGSRSLLADPRKLENKEKLNRVIKRRESFRPFAPVVMQEFAAGIFELGKQDSPFMLRTVPVKAEWRIKIPAAIHVDGSARVQTLKKETNPELHALLAAFHELSQVPVLLNTSLNTAEEPIVNTAQEALDLFRRTSIDILVLDDWVLEKN